MDALHGRTNAVAPPTEFSLWDGVLVDFWGLKAAELPRATYIICTDTTSLLAE